MDFHDTILTVKDVQAILNCGKRQAYELMRLPGFPAMKLGGRYFISSKGFERWLQKNMGRTIRK